MVKESVSMEQKGMSKYCNLLSGIEESQSWLYTSFEIRNEWTYSTYLEAIASRAREGTSSWCIIVHFLV